MMSERPHQLRRRPALEAGKLIRPLPAKSAQRFAQVGSEYSVDRLAFANDVRQYHTQLGHQTLSVTSENAVHAGSGHDRRRRQGRKQVRHNDAITRVQGNRALRHRRCQIGKGTGGRGGRVGIKALPRSRGDDWTHALWIRQNEIRGAE